MHQVSHETTSQSILALGSGQKALPEEQGRARPVRCSYLPRRLTDDWLEFLLTLGLLLGLYVALIESCLF
jgi:hypothetical protein